MGWYDDFYFILISYFNSHRVKNATDVLYTKSDTFSNGHGVKRTVCYVMIESSDSF